MVFGALMVVIGFFILIKTWESVVSGEHEAHRRYGRSSQVSLGWWTSMGCVPLLIGVGSIYQALPGQ
ncbi:hypothetical protein SAMN05445060_4135 [Williamsia sterculiae]|uniref:Uncharacterized protein n=1 Tax=Williamsia sterculiae TaxID=1344003 RepID=A0A1N7HF61_9NOCA|nr:hypothetical protein SAMN05445060_4135 [Williamsia sterculiae]